MAEPEISFEAQTMAARQRLRGLNQRAQTTSAHDLMPYVLQELALLLDLLKIAEAEIRNQEQIQLSFADAQIAEAQRYRDLFDHAPVAYFITSLDGTLQRLNRAATELFGTDARQLVGRSLALFVPEGERRTFRTSLTQLSQATEPVNHTITIHTWNDYRQLALLRTSVLRGPSGRPTALVWVALNPTFARERAEDRVAITAR